MNILLIMSNTWRWRRNIDQKGLSDLASNTNYTPKAKATSDESKELRTWLPLLRSITGWSILSSFPLLLASYRALPYVTASRWDSDGLVRWAVTLCKKRQHNEICLLCISPIRLYKFGVAGQTPQQRECVSGTKPSKPKQSQILPMQKKEWKSNSRCSVVT